MSRVRLIAASALATLADLVALLVLVHGLHLGRGVATTLACVAGGVVNFALCRAWLGGGAGRPGLSMAAQAALYGGLVVVGGGFWSGVVVHAVTAGLALPLLAAKALATGLVLVAWNYPISTQLVFRGR